MSRWTIQCQLQRVSCKNTLSHRTPMLTEEKKDVRIQWTTKHKEDDWSRTIFTDETSYQGSMKIEHEER